MDWSLSIGLLTTGHRLGLKGQGSSHPRAHDSSHIQTKYLQKEKDQIISRFFFFFAVIWLLNHPLSLTYIIIHSFWVEFCRFPLDFSLFFHIAIFITIFLEETGLKPFWSGIWTTCCTLKVLPTSSHFQDPLPIDFSPPPPQQLLFPLVVPTIF